MAIEKELVDQLLAGRDPNEVFSKDGLLDDLKQALSERILNAELDEHLDGERSEGTANRRNGVVVARGDCPDSQYTAWS
jgi:putative transposase